jgi:hypothetical protein
MAARAVVERIAAVVRLLPALLLESGPPRPLAVSRIPTVPPPDPSSVVPPSLFTVGALDGDSLGILLGVSLGAMLGWSDGALLGSVLGLPLGESEAVVASVNIGVMLGTVLGASLKVSRPGDESGVLVHSGHCGIGPARGMEVSVCNNDRNLFCRKHRSEYDLSTYTSTVVTNRCLHLQSRIVFLRHAIGFASQWRQSVAYRIRAAWMHSPQESEQHGSVHHASPTMSDLFPASMPSPDRYGIAWKPVRPRTSRAISGPEKPHDRAGANIIGPILLSILRSFDAASEQSTRMCTT